MIARRHFHLTNRLVQLMKHNLITHKFYYGQGGQLRFDLTNRKYHIEVQTIWEDHCLLQIQGLTGIQNFRLQQQNSISYFDDKQLNNNLNQLISVKLKVPEDYTFNGTINGSLDHVNSQVGRNMRSKPFSLNILGNNHVLNMGNLKSQNISIQNAGGSVSFSGLTVQNGIVRANKIASKKIMTSKYLQLVCNELNIVSLLMFGPSKGKLTCKTGKIESVGGDCQIQAQKLRLDRYYGGDNSINIKCSAIQGKIGIQTGSGSIEFKDEQQLSQNRQKVLLGRLHKGKATVNKNKIDIL